MKKCKLLAIIVLLGLAACTSDGNWEEGEKPKPNNEKVSYVKIKIDPAISSRIINEYDQVFKGDNVIHNLDIYILEYNPSDEEYYVVDKISRDDVKEGKPAEDGILHEVLIKTEIPPGVYSLYVVANSKNEFADKMIVNSNGKTKIASYPLCPDNFDEVINKIQGGFMIMTNENRKNKGIFSSKIQLNYNPIDKPAKGYVSLDRIGAAVKVVGDEKLAFKKAGVTLPPNMKFVVSGFVTLNVQDHTFVSLNWYGDDDHKFVKSTIKESSYQNSLGVYSEIKNNKVVGIQPNAENLFTPDAKALIENNSNKFTELRSGLKPLQYATTGVIFCLKLLDLESKELKSFYTTRLGDQITVHAKDENTSLPEGSVDYPNGMFYTYFIEDPNLHVFGEKYLVIVRNTAYKVNLKSVQQFGSPYPGGDIKNPNDLSQRVDEKYNYTYHVSVNKWKDGCWDINL